jgi:transcriptional regulator with XRE-family HTH domain
MDLGDPGTASHPLGVFCARLKRLQTQSGIKQADLLGAVGLKRSQVSDILNAKIERPPGWGVTIAIVRACLEHAKATGRLVPPDVSDEADWQRRYFDLEQDLDTGARARPRREEPAGRLLAEVTDPFALEVHHPVQSDGPQHGLPALPVYVAREHDVELGRVVAAAARGDSGVVVLVGGSSTGKTRACWEALELLREQDRPWRLWHPIDPARPEAALRELPSVGPRTVVWLNETQFYLDASGGLGERIAAGLREALRDSSRAPVLVLATLWPQYWDLFTARPAAGEDSRAQARELLAARDITVPAALTAQQLEQLPALGDPRLTQATEAAEGGQVIQFLAGGTGADGPLPQRPAGRGCADQHSDGCAPPGHGVRAAADLPEAGGTRLPDR